MRQGLELNSGEKSLEDCAVCVSAKQDDSTVSIEGVIEKSGCSLLYELLEECLGENDRDWKRCRESLEAFRDCHSKNNPGIRDETI